MDVDYSTPEISMAAISGHKFQGPKGVGALVRKRGIKLNPILHGGNQELGLRSGTLPTPLIVGLGAIALHVSLHHNEIKRQTQKDASQILEILKTNQLSDNLVPKALRSCHIIPTLTNGMTAEEFLSQTHLHKEFNASRGSACRSGLIQHSHVINAMIGESSARRFIRFSI